MFARKRVLPNRVLGNVFIAVGALLPASAGTFIRLGWGDWLYVSELFGAALMFLGFWLATQPQPADRPPRPRRLGRARPIANSAYRHEMAALANFRLWSQLVTQRW